MDKSKLKLKTIEDLKTLTKLVNEWDPIGLIEGGAPDDEYSCIVPAILRKLQNGENANEIFDYYTGDISGHFGFSVFSVPEPYKQELISRTKESINRICYWYKTESLSNSNEAFSRFVIEKEINELKYKYLSSHITDILTEIEFRLQEEYQIVRFDELEVWEFINGYNFKNKFDFIGYEFNHQLWIVSENVGSVDKVFENLNELVIYLSPLLTTV